MIGTNLDLAKLRRVAEDTLNAQRETASGLRGEQRRIEADQMWGLTANPGAILALLDHIDALQAELDRAKVQHDMLCDSNYVAGMKTGWNFAIAGDDAGYQAVVECRKGHRKEPPHDES